MIYFIADNHFGHKNIIKYCNRPFKSTNEMDRHMIKMWNSKVKPSDIIYMLGDFSLTDDKNTKAILRELKGYKILVMGNHDERRTYDFWMNAGFDEVHADALLLNRQYLLSHKRVKDYRYYNIHGHNHDKISNRYRPLHSICVSVELINYTPISIDKIEKRILKNYNKFKN